MSDSSESIKYKWSPEGTALLVSVWSDRQVQKQLEYATKPQIIWESVAKYMKKKGYNVTGKQCRSRMKQVLVCYREAKRAGTRAGVEQYYESIDRVLKNKRLEDINVPGIDTVDAMINVKSPPKDVKTNKNLQMRHKFQEPVQSLHRSEALSPTWTLGRENECPDSPESNETIIARPYSMLSPTRDVGINTGEQLMQIAGKSTQFNSLPLEEPVRVSYKQNLLQNFPYGEIPFQNAVQNVQNQIIQENMQQNQNFQPNRMCNQPQNMLVNNLNLQHNLHNLNQNVPTQSTNVPLPINSMAMQSTNLEHMIQQQQYVQQYVNRAMPQEPRRVAFEQNFPNLYKQQFGGLSTNTATDTKQNESLNYSPNISQNLNDAFCQSKTEDNSHNLNETYNRVAQMTNPSAAPNADISVITNNATCNDDSLLLEFLMNSPTPSDSDNKLKDTAVNTDDIPHVPLRKKKAQKLEQLVLSAISSQNDVVNKILAAQNDMLTKFLDIDRDRQNRLETRLDNLLKVVHTSVLTKPSSETDVDIPPPPPEPIITSLVPPPRPGIAPPKLDLVPPKPCRVPCTVPNSNVELINQNPIMTKPGIVSPIASPVKKPGTIWSKLGPVSQSPFVKAQQRLGLLQAISGAESRTQSSAERRIAKEMERITADMGTVKFETKNFLDAEKLMEEKIENARLETTISQTLHARRRLFTQREPTAAMILTAAFLENENRASEQAMYCDTFSANKKRANDVEDDLLSGQGESYERLRQLNVQPAYGPGEPCDTSTPAKFGAANGDEPSAPVQKPTIQQLAQIVMNAGRWKNLAAQNVQQNSVRPVSSNAQKQQQNGYNAGYNEDVRMQSNPVLKENEIRRDQNHIQDWKANKYGNSNEQNAGPSYNIVNRKSNFPIGFTTAMLESENPRKDPDGDVCKPVGFNGNVLPDRKQQSVRFMDEALAELYRMYCKEQQEKNDSLPYVPDNGNGKCVSFQSRQMIEKYINEVMPRKQFGKDKDTDSDNDDEFLDTTATMPVIVPRRGSLTSTGTTSTDTAHSIKFSKPDNCVIS